MLAPPNDLAPPPMKPRLEAAKRGELQDPPPGRPPQANELMFHDLMDRFSILAEHCARFSREVYGRTGSLPQQDLERTIRRHLDLSRAIFSQYIIVRRLTALERFGIVQRTVTGESPMDARYALTHKGTVIARLGEPVMLYIRLAEGWFNGQPPAPRAVAENPPPKTTIP